GSLGVLPIIYKFYPYYKDNLPNKKIDLLTWAFTAALIGFTLVLIGGYFFEPIVVRKFSRTSKLFVDYYHWVFLFAFGMLFYSVLESYSWGIHKSVLTNFLKETLFRGVTLIFITLFLFKVIDFDIFIKLYSFLYLLILAILAVILYKENQLPITFEISRVTKRFYKKIASMQALVFGGICVMTLGQTIDSIMIAGVQGIKQTGIYSLAIFASSLIGVPQRSLQSIATGILSRAWKEKDYAEINRIYKRSCINLLIFAIFIFGNLWLNIEAGFTVLNIQASYTAGISSMLILGIARIIDAGTGVNGTVVGTSNYWRFDFLSGVCLLAVRLPLAYIFLKQYGLIGMAYSELVSQVLYNFLRYELLRRKFNMQPFDEKTIYSLLVAALSFAITYFLLKDVDGWTGIILRSGLFTSILLAGIFALQLTPDAMQLYHKFIDRFKK
ncbi:MAG: hypothetical protein JWQ96_1879, partial [Segetibacter sp.]|nr:hypothetical protein [Segetibacter sp.]